MFTVCSYFGVLGACTRQVASFTDRAGALAAFDGLIRDKALCVAVYNPAGSIVIAFDMLDGSPRYS